MVGEYEKDNNSFFVIFIVGCNKTVQENNGKVLSEYENAGFSQETAFIDSFTIYGRYFNLTDYLEKMFQI